MKILQNIYVVGDPDKINLTHNQIKEWAKHICTIYGIETYSHNLKNNCHELIYTISSTKYNKELMLNMCSFYKEYISRFDLGLFSYISVNTYNVDVCAYYCNPNSKNSEYIILFSNGTTTTKSKKKLKEWKEFIEDNRIKLLL